MIEIARFADVYEAEIVAARLRADGFRVVLGGAEHAKTDPLILQALGWVRLNVPDDEAVAAAARLEALRAGSDVLPETFEQPSAETPDRTLPARVTLAAALFALIAGR